jgi:hypothetical protein
LKRFNDHLYGCCRGTLVNKPVQIRPRLLALNQIVSAACAGTGAARHRFLPLSSTWKCAVTMRRLYCLFVIEAGSPYVNTDDLTRPISRIAYRRVPDWA